MAVNYFAGFDKDILDPNKAILESLAAGAQINQYNQAAAAHQAQAAKVYAEQQLEAKRQAYIEDLTSNPTEQKEQQFALLFPEQAEHIRKTHEAKTAEAQQSDMLNYSRVYSAAKNGNAGVANTLVSNMIEANQNGAGDKNELEILKNIQAGLSSPDVATQQATLKQVQSITGIHLNTVNKDWAKGQREIGIDSREEELQPDVLREQVSKADKAESDASIASTTAQYAPEKVRTDIAATKAGIQKTGSDIQVNNAQIQNYEDDAAFKRESNKLRAMEGALARENSDLRRQELQLKVDEQRQKLAGMGAKPLTEQQSKDVLFGARMQQAHSILTKLEGKGVSAPLLSRLFGEAGTSTANVLPEVIGGASSEQQQYMQAQRDFLNAILRKESGAAIMKSEFENGQKQYFPQIGDSKDVEKQKAQNRELALKMVLTGAGSQGQSNAQQAIGSVTGQQSAPVNGKIYARSQVMAWAKAKGIDPQQAIQKITESGGQVR